MAAAWRLSVVFGAEGRRRSNCGVSVGVGVGCRVVVAVVNGDAEVRRRGQTTLPLFFSLVVQEVAFGGELGATIRSRSVRWLIELKVERDQRAGSDN